MSVTLMFRKVGQTQWTATVTPGRSHVMVGLVPEGWRASVYWHDDEGDLQVTECGVFSTRKEAQQGASETVLGVTG